MQRTRIPSKFIQTYGHDGRIGVLVEFTLKGESITIRMPEFHELAIAVHIAAARPASLEALLVQPFVKDTSVTVAAHISKVSAQPQENINVARFVRWECEPVPPSVPPIAPPTHFACQVGNDA
ncbi:MAG TPA: hypothetical protein VML92_10275 [Steroidobacteraceae bacterium]|nr:hypothetical protein [Steroidobacteraceae bacterium]